MVGSRRGQAIPTQLGLGLFERFVLPHLSTGSRGPAPKLGLFKIFNYIFNWLRVSPGHQICLKAAAERDFRALPPIG